MDVRAIPSHETHEWCNKKHYAHRIPSISFAFGLYAPELAGIVTYGTPPSPPLRSGVCGPGWAESVMELNRLCVDEDAPKNAASFLVGRSLRLLPHPSVVVSFADIGQGHIGYIYQACNFIYTGLSAKRTDWTIDGMEHLHGVTVADMSRGQENRAQYMRAKFGDSFRLEDRPRKHRYVFFVGDRKQRREMRKALMYPVESYPKGKTARYDASHKCSIQLTLY